MAVTKYPNYLEELLKLKLKESVSNIKSRKLPTKHEKFKFTNVSEERLNLAVQLAQKDVKEGNIAHDFIQRRKAKGNFASHHHENNIDDGYDYDDRPGTGCNCNGELRDVTPHHKDLPLRTMSPPVRDENSEPTTKKKSIVTQQEASVEFNRLKTEILRLIGEVHEHAKVNTRSKEDPAEAERRRVRVGERTNRIGRLTYDLGRGTKDFLNDVRRGRRQDSLKKLLHFYKESLKVLKMVAMQTSDSSDPPSFLRSKIFPDLVAILSDLSFSAVELDVDSTTNEREPALELRKILDFSSANGKRRVHFPRMHRPPSVPPPPSSPWSDQDFNNNIVQQKQLQWLQTNRFPIPADDSEDKSVIKMSNGDGRPASQDLELPKYRADEVHREEQSSKVKVGNTDQDSRRQLLKKCLLLLMERNFQKERKMGGGDELKLGEGQAKVKWVKSRFAKPRLNNVAGGTKPKKVPPMAHHGKPSTAPAHLGRSTLSNHRARKTANSVTCNHAVETEKMLRLSESSPPSMFMKVADKDNEESCDDDRELGRPKPSEVEEHERRKAPKSHRDHRRLKVVHESSSSGCRSDSESEVCGADGRSSIEALSSLTSSNIRKFDKRLKEFEIERRKMKERWPSGGVKNGESLPPEPQAISGKPWIEDFEKEFRRDVADTKNIFHHLAAGGESFDCNRADDISVKLLHDWNRRDREFFSFRLFNGDSHSGDDRNGSTTRLGEKSVNKLKGNRTDVLGECDDCCARQPDEGRVQLASKLASVALHQEPIDLMVNREALSEMLVKRGELKSQVKDGIMRLLDSQSGDGADHAFLSSRMARDLLEDCLQEVCNEADFVGNEIVNRVYKSELSPDGKDS